jgi:dolichol-phosphate mannosyltransferase
MATVDIVTSALNEELCISEFISRVNKVFDNETAYSHRIIIIDNGSTDSTWEVISKHVCTSKHVRGIRMSRTFSFDSALTCGMDQAESDYLVIMASDLQDPPEVIHDLLREIEKGYDQVVVRIGKRGEVPWLRRVLSRCFYGFSFWATNGLIPKNVSDFRLMSRKVYCNVRQLRENHRLMRGLTAWTGFSTTSITIERPNRFAGKSKWLGTNLLTVMLTALRATFAFSVKPLLIVSLTSIIFGVTSIFSLLPLTVFFIIYGVPFGGFGSLIGFAILSFGILMLTLGVICLYLSLTFEETQNRPLYIIESTIQYEQTL